MRFIVKQTGYSTERIGSLTGFLRSPGAEIETPTAALFTQVKFIGIILEHNFIKFILGNSQEGGFVGIQLMYAVIDDQPRGIGRSLNCNMNSVPFLGTYLIY